MHIFKVLVFLFLFGFNALAESKPFVIYPFTLLSPNNEIILRFQLKKSADIFISKSIDLEVKTLENRRFLVDKVYSINLGEVPCDKNFFYQIEFLEKNQKFKLKQQIHSLPCQEDQAIVSFGLLGDTQRMNQLHPKMAKVIEKQSKKKINYLLHAGDIVQYGGIPGEWVQYFREGHSYLKKYPAITAVGNHEYWLDNKKDALPLAYQKYFGVGPEEDLGNIHFRLPLISVLTFNSNIDKMSPSIRDEQFEWLEGQLVELKEKGRKGILLLHHPPLSSASGKKDPFSQYLRKRLIPLLEKYKSISLILSGHTHLYERSLKETLTYLVTGPAGAWNGFIKQPNPYSQIKNLKASTFTILTVNKKSIKIETFNERNFQIDSIEIPL